MDATRRNVILLACCQSLLLTNAVTQIAIVPASFWMRRVGRRNGFLTGGALGLVGSVIATAAVAAGSIALLCAGTFLRGAYKLLRIHRMVFTDQHDSFGIMQS